MNRKEALSTILRNLKKDVAVISTLGLISRELFGLGERDQIFYMTGSMGLASSIGLGIALNKKIKVLVIDGDGSLLMNMGSLVTIGSVKPHNLIHLVLDNRAYASCSEEASHSTSVRLEKVAKVTGYRFIKVVNTTQELAKALKKVFKINDGPSFILAKIKLGGERNLPRILDLRKIAERFRKFLSNYN